MRFKLPGLDPFMAHAVCRFTLSRQHFLNVGHDLLKDLPLVAIRGFRPIEFRV